MPNEPTAEKGKEGSLPFSKSLALSVLDSITAHVAILDEKGVILETNRAWNEFACQTTQPCQTDFRGVNYLAVCDTAKGKGARDAKTVAAGIRAVIKKETEEFLYDYPCHSPTEKRWFYMRSVPIAGMNPTRVAVSHEDITALKLAEEELRRQKQRLEESNTALKVLLEQRENDRNDLEKAVLNNVKQNILPYVKRLMTARLKPKEKALAEIIHNQIGEVISPLLQRLSNADILLTPQENQVAILVRDGKTSKEIAEILIVSEATVHFNRKNIREKFGLKSSRTNLRSYLMSLSKR